MESVLAIVMGFIGKYPVTASVLMGMGMARAIFKPLCALLKAVVEATPTPKDNELLEKAEKSSLVKYALMALDYVASIKIPPKV